MKVEKGSMQYKKKGDGVYLAVYNAEKKGYDWNHLGSWTDLRNLIYQEALPNVTPISDVSSPKEA